MQQIFRFACPKMVKFSCKMVALKMLKVITVLFNHVKQAKIETPIVYNFQSFLQTNVSIVWDYSKVPTMISNFSFKFSNEKAYTAYFSAISSLRFFSCAVS